VLDRASSFADRDVIELLQRRFVPVALDVWYEERREDAAGDFFRKVVFQREGLVPGRTTQGFYAFAPDGTLLEGWNHRGVDRLKERLAASLAEWKPGEAAALTGAVDARFDRSLPAGARVAEVRARITDAKWPAPQDEFRRTMQQATSLDHLWLLAPEIEQLRAGVFPPALARRIARFHCIDNTRGEPPTWEPAEVVRCELSLAPDPSPAAAASARQEVSGSITLATADGQRRFTARVGGMVEFQGDALSRLDLAIRGLFAGGGEYTRDPPPGDFTLAIVLRLIDPEPDGSLPPSARVPPQGARWLDDYLGRVAGR
jgi:hypothetical protein